VTEERAGPQELRRLLHAVAAVGSDLDLEVILRRIVEAAAELVGAAYGALGVLNHERSNLSDFVTVGLDPDTEAAIGARPKGHGILGLLIVDPRPLRLPDLGAHPDSFGFPPNHPPMTAFLGVPIFVGGLAYGNLYLTDKEGGGPFTDIDEELAVALAGAAGTAIEKARLHARIRELDLIADRDRIARDLHDTVIQRLFATGLALQGAARLAGPLPEVAERIQQAVDELDLVVRQVRSSIFELHAAETSVHGVRRQLLALGDELSAALGYAPAFQFEGPVDAAVGEEAGGHLLAAVGESLANIARHAESPVARVHVRVADGLLTATIEDEGVGLGPRRPGGHGIENLERRAHDLGGRATVETRAAGGTRVTWSVPVA
jgi:signal transduction histidine kinase